jgi:hypothetical protein
MTDASGRPTTVTVASVAWIATAVLGVTSGIVLFSDIARFAESDVTGDGVALAEGIASVNASVAIAFGVLLAAFALSAGLATA